MGSYQVSVPHGFGKCNCHQCSKTEKELKKFLPRILRNRFQVPGRVLTACLFVLGFAGSLCEVWYWAFVGGDFISCVNKLGLLGVVGTLVGLYYHCSFGRFLFCRKKLYGFIDNDGNEHIHLTSPDSHRMLINKKVRRTWTTNPLKSSNPENYIAKRFFSFYFGGLWGKCGHFYRNDCASYDDHDWINEVEGSYRLVRYDHKTASYVLKDEYGRQVYADDIANLYHFMFHKYGRIYNLDHMREQEVRHEANRVQTETDYQFKRNLVVMIIEERVGRLKSRSQSAQKVREYLELLLAENLKASDLNTIDHLKHFVFKATAELVDEISAETLEAETQALIHRLCKLMAITAPIEAAA